MIINIRDSSNNDEPRYSDKRVSGAHPVILPPKTQAPRPPVRRRALCQLSLRRGYLTAFGPSGCQRPQRSECHLREVRRTIRRRARWSGKRDPFPALADEPKPLSVRRAIVLLHSCIGELLNQDSYAESEVDPCFLDQRWLIGHPITDHISCQSFLLELIITQLDKASCKCYDGSCRAYCLTFLMTSITSIALMGFLWSGASGVDLRHGLLKPPHQQPPQKVPSPYGSPAITPCPNRPTAT